MSNLWRPREQTWGSSALGVSGVPLARLPGWVMSKYNMTIFQIHDQEGSATRPRPLALRPMWRPKTRSSTPRGTGFWPRSSQHHVFWSRIRGTSTVKNIEILLFTARWYYGITFTLHYNYLEGLRTANFNDHWQLLQDNVRVPTVNDQQKYRNIGTFWC